MRSHSVRPPCDYVERYTITRACLSWQTAKLVGYARCPRLVRTGHLIPEIVEVVRADQSGDSRIPDEFRRLPRETSPGDRVPLDVVARWAHGMAAHYLPKETLMPMEGIARVLALLESDGYERSLVLATPLYVAFHETEEPRDGGQRIATDSLRRMQRWSSLRRV